MTQSTDELKKRIQHLEAEIAALKGTRPATGKVSPLAPKGGFPDLVPIDGVAFAAGCAGVRYRNRTDVMAVKVRPGGTIAGVFTRSATRSPSVIDCETKLAGLAGQCCRDGLVIIVNSGNANAFTGHGGIRAVEQITARAARVFGVPSAAVFTASTGVIGEKLPHDRIEAILEDLKQGLDATGIGEAARAITTTDTFPKGAGAQFVTEHGTINIVGIAKGSGMIAPDMATMLAYIFTDATIEQGLLQTLLTRINRKTFNSITVDSDTSTSDMALAVATGTSDAEPILAANDPVCAGFEAALEDIMTNLAKQIVRDGEGASKFVTVTVTGAQSMGDADRVARSIANSPLVKTAITGEDPNWGRVVMAVGKSGAVAERDRLVIRFGEICVAENGRVARDYAEADAAVYMRSDEIEITVDLGLGEHSARIWTCDFTNQYIAINTDYRS
ncbi:MAG: bifunctional glutamate N-acetyltransferase/amino-acid acetyltransferase ArgJ [Rhodobacteraceae bacterium]|nr:bifunctional glutamate N-acetyltransferase/amino-acid acetyltransferase ArgJ [Paracoccaceae bacterium]